MAHGQNSPSCDTLSPLASNGGTCATCGTLEAHKNTENERKFWQIWHNVHFAKCNLGPLP